MSAGHGTRAIVAALLANLGIAVAKFVGFLVTGSGALLAEGVHSVADSGNQALLLLGSRRAQRPATPVHPFGYGRERYFWAFVVAVVLFTLGSAFAVLEGIEKLREPHEVESPVWAVGILSVAIVLESLSFRTAVQVADRARAGAGWWRYIRRARAPEVPVVLLEDLGALLGLVIALVAVLLTVATDDPVFDAAGTLTIGVLLGVIALFLAAEMKSLLIGESATERQQQAIRRTVEDHGSVRHLLHLRTQHLGPDELLVALKVSFAKGLSVGELAAAVNDVEAAVREQVPEARVMYVEPDLVQAETVS